MMIIRRLQENVAPHIFTPKAVYDGRKNIFSARQLPLEGKSQTVRFSFVLSTDAVLIKGYYSLM